MKTTIKTLKKIALVALFTLISATAFAAPYYVCQGSTVYLKPSVAAANPISYTWIIDGGSPQTISPDGSGKYAIPIPNAAGPHTVVMRSTSSDNAICAPADEQTDFLALPPLAFDLSTAPSNAAYCTSAGVNAKSVITPSAVTGFPAGTPYSDDLEKEYSYSVVKTSNGSTVDGLTVGTIDQTTGAFTLTTTAIDTYTITGTVKYKQKTSPTNPGSLIGAGCPTVATTTRVVNVIAAPAQPTISVSAN